MNRSVAISFRQTLMESGLGGDVSARSAGQHGMVRG